MSLFNFKAFDELELGAINLLSGLNGTGKSSVLRTQAVLRQSTTLAPLPRASWSSTAPSSRSQRVATPSIGTSSSAGSASFGLDEPTGAPGLAWSADPRPDADVLACDLRPAASAFSEVNLFATGFQFLRADRIAAAVGVQEAECQRRRFHASFVVRVVPRTSPQDLIDRNMFLPSPSRTIAASSSAKDPASPATASCSLGSHP